VYVVRDLPGVRGFKIVQHSLQRTEVQIVADEGFDRPARAAEIAAGLQRRLGQGVQVEVNYVDAIAPEKSGKYRYVVSHVAAAAPAPETSPHA
ncbi:capsule biosynthesis protein CapK, partial [Rubrivivax gelatinosus]|nr:capsule biosynthesis protein CapK [Rubrivivax gelatinosus]